MKALILAAGYATRLYPLTLNHPKPLLKVGGKTIVEHIVEKLENISELNEIFIVTNNKFYSHFVKLNNNLTSSKKITIVNDGTLSNEDRLGAIGDINFVVKKHNIQENLLIIGGDNLFEDNLKNIINYFQQKQTSSILLNDIKCFKLAKQLGIVSVNKNNKIIEFIEKPENPKSTLAATLVYMLKKEDLEMLQEALDNKFADRAGDFIKYLSEKKEVHALTLEGTWFDIGNMSQLKEAEKYFDNKNKLID
ncbi:nucleotidyltransferase family protein [archaeon]|jgi:glucose-1-phosphate thymidylyltransferase|nr:nucleotidyltransferase family protein [archaeon]MBT3451331.1 nucleotidyltransferase family protein [archaeon]MBT6869353.1 nucleotidyltransferase family protein [archaeon]MBT7192516.1 nucleotidyltransferase family protein [archaeon]MBT7380592.1 nucleotidyltransferase family protein [archaeon]